MTDPARPASPEPVTTAGAWLGLGLAVRGALGVISGVGGLVIVPMVTLMIDWTGKLADESELPPEVGSLLEVLFELTTIVRPYAQLVGGTAIGIGLLLFASSVGVIAGNDRARKSARALLVADIVHSVASSVWLAALWLGPLGAWNSRLLRTVEEMHEAVPGSGASLPPGFDASAALNLVSLAVSLVFSVGIAGVLCWVAGRPFARRWCGSQDLGSPVASASGPR